MIEMVQVALDADSWPIGVNGNPMVMSYRDVTAWEAAWRAMRWKPVSRNLWTLCTDCNKGKSDSSL